MSKKGLGIIPLRLSGVSFFKRSNPAPACLSLASAYFMGKLQLMAIEIDIKIKIPVEDAIALQEGFLKASGATQAQLTQVMMDAWTKAATTAFTSMAEANMQAMLRAFPFTTLGKK